MEGGKQKSDLDLHDVESQTAAPVAAFQGSLIRNQIGYIPPSSNLPKDITKGWQWALYFSTGWTDEHIWKSAFVEMIASASLIVTSGMMDVTYGNYNISQAATYVGVTNIVLLTLFILAAAPASGGHIDPLITFSTMLTGLTGFSRGTLIALLNRLAR